MLKHRCYIFLGILMLFTSVSFIAPPDITIEKQEALKAYNLLNKVRANPDKYYKQYRFEAGGGITKTILSWNDTLAKVAESRAYDMAARNYFAHINPDGIAINYLIQQSGYLLKPAWTANKASNFFESLTAGATDGEDAIAALITDDDDKDKGHRKHLLGMGRWYGSLVDIGIGFVRQNTNGKYVSYTCVVIAKHE